MGDEQTHEQPRSDLSHGASTAQALHDLSPQVVAIMTTEHYNLQSGRAMTISDSSGRSSLFLSTVSITLVALAFVGQFSQLGTAFYRFALVLLPSLFFIGFVTFERVLQSAIEDFILARGINRLRHFYVELAPTVKDYFILSTHDDEQSAFGNMGLRRSPWQVFLTTPGMIAFIDSVLAGAFAGLLVSYLFARATACGRGGLRRLSRSASSAHAPMLVALECSAAERQDAFPQRRSGG